MIQLFFSLLEKDSAPAARPQSYLSNYNKRLIFFRMFPHPQPLSKGEGS